MNAININAALAIATALLIVGTFNHMDKTTTTAIRLSVLMIFAGLLAQGFGIVLKQWDHYADTMVIGGIAALFVAGRRTPCGIPLKYTPMISIGITCGTFFYTAVMWKWT